MGAQLSPASARRVHLAASGAEINSARIERIDCHRISQHVYVAIALRQTLRERLPLVAACPAAVNAQLPFKRKMLRVAFYRDHVNGFRLVRMNVDHEPKIGGQISADLRPLIAGVIAAHHVPVLLHEKNVGTRRVHRDAMDAVANFGSRIREETASAIPG